MVVGAGSQDPQCESPDVGILFKSGSMEGGRVFYRLMDPPDVGAG